MSYAVGDLALRSYAIFDGGHVFTDVIGSPYQIFPSFYLKTNVKVSKGSGEREDPYILRM